MAVSLFCDTAAALRMHECMKDAAPVLLPLVLHLLAPAVMHVMQHSEQLQGLLLAEICDEYAELVAHLLASGGAGTVTSVHLLLSMPCICYYTTSLHLLL
jgi:hypothetical protein